MRNICIIKYSFLLLGLLLVISCKTKKNLLSPGQSSVIKIEFLRNDKSVNLDSLFVLDHSKLEKIKVDVRKKNRIALHAKITSSVHSLSSDYAGIDRIVEYDFTHQDVPEAFEGFRIAFISDLHYKSLLKETGLNNLVKLLNSQNVDLLLMGGDYQEGCEYVKPLFSALARVYASMGTFGVLGNNDYERCYDEIINTMERNGIHPLEQQVDTLRKAGQQIIIAGIRNPFDLKHNGVSPTLDLSPDDFVILLVHTPDYIEDVSVDNTDLALAGHTHGGQIRLWGYAPVQNSHYGNRFLAGLAYNSSDVPIIITNGIGTSRMPIRLGAPAEIIMITLH